MAVEAWWQELGAAEHLRTQEAESPPEIGVWLGSLGACPKGHTSSSEALPPKSSIDFANSATAG